MAKSSKLKNREVPMAERKQSIGFEEAFSKLTGIVELLEKGDTPLEESLKAFEEGMKLVKICGEKLNEAETRLNLLIKENDSFRLEPME